MEAKDGCKFMSRKGARDGQKVVSTLGELNSQHQAHVNGWTEIPALGPALGCGS